VTAQAKHIIDEFLALPDEEKREVLAQLVRTAPSPTLSDEELLSAADEIFLGYERREGSD
jgi:predicted HAD superfamily phosphohydrolase